MNFKVDLLPARPSCAAGTAIFWITFATNFADHFHDVVRHLAGSTIAKHYGLVETRSQSLLLLMTVTHSLPREGSEKIREPTALASKFTLHSHPCSLLELLSNRGHEIVAQTTV